MRSYVYLEIETFDSLGIIEAEIDRNTFNELNLSEASEVYLDLRNIKYFSSDNYTI